MHVDWMQANVYLYMYAKLIRGLRPKLETRGGEIASIDRPSGRRARKLNDSDFVAGAAGRQTWRIINRTKIPRCFGIGATIIIKVLIISIIIRALLRALL